MTKIGKNIILVVRIKLSLALVLGDIAEALTTMADNARHWNGYAQILRIPRSVRMAGPSRQQLPDFLLARIGQLGYPGLVWREPGRTVFNVPWPRFDGDSFDLNRDATLFKEWERNQGRPVSPPNPTKWKSRLRNAIARSREIEEVSDQIRTEGGQPCRVYRFVDHVNQVSPVQSSAGGNGTPLPMVHVTVNYRGHQVNALPLQSDCWVHYPPAMSPQEQQQVLQVLPPDVTWLELPPPANHNDPINQVLGNFKQGIFLYMSAGCVYAVRRCVARVYYRRASNPGVENVLQRDEAVELLNLHMNGDVQNLRADLSVGQSFQALLPDLSNSLIVIQVAAIHQPAAFH